MPPPDNDVKAKPLTPQELGLIKLWIDQGAKGEVKAAGAHDRLAAAAAGHQSDLRRRDHARRPIRRRLAGQPDFPLSRAEQARAGPADRSVAAREGHLQAAGRGRPRPGAVAEVQPRRHAGSPPAASARSSSGRSPAGGKKLDLAGLEGPARSHRRQQPTASWRRSAKRRARSRCSTSPTARSSRRSQGHSGAGHRRGVHRRRREARHRLARQDVPRLEPGRSEADRFDRDARRRSTPWRSSPKASRSPPAARDNSHPPVGAARQRSRPKPPSRSRR